MYTFIKQGILKKENIKSSPGAIKEPACTLLVPSNYNFNAALWGQDLSWRQRIDKIGTHHRI